MNNIFKRIIGSFVLIGLTAFNTHAQLNQITGITIEEKNQVTVMTIASADTPSYLQYTLNSTTPGIKEKLVIDISGARYSIDKLLFQQKVGPIANIRASQYFENPPVVRIVADLQSPAAKRFDITDGKLQVTFSNYAVMSKPQAVVTLPIAKPEEKAEMKGEKFPVLNLKEAPLGIVIEIFQRDYGMNVIISKTVKTDEKITLYIPTECDRERLLETILDANDYKFFKRDSIYIILGKSVSIEGELKVEIFKLNYINANDIVENLKSIGTKDKGVVQVVTRKPIGTTAIKMPQSTGGAAGGAGGATGGGGGNPLAGVEDITQQTAEQVRSDQILVYDYPVIIEKMRNIIKQLDTAPPQVHIMVNVVETRLGDTEKWGVNWQPIMEAIGTGGGAAGGAATGAAGAGAAGGAVGQQLGLPLNIGSFRGGTLSLAQFKIAFDWLRRREDSRLINQPSITTMHNQQASIAVVTSIPIEVTQVGMGMGGAGGGAAAGGGGAAGGAGGQTGIGSITTIQNQNIAVLLSVIPQVNEDKYVTLWVTPIIQEPAGYTGKNGDLPIVSSRTAITQVRVKSGDVLVIGGIIKEDKIKTVNSVKFLGALPLLGNLFRHNNIELSRSELIIFMCPEIIKTVVETENGGDIIR